jgi:hypothetical protein
MRLKKLPEVPGRDMLGIVALTEIPEVATEERFEAAVSGAIAIDVRRKLEGWGEAAVTVLTDDVSEGLRERFCMC